jgi:hypothetical protein
MSLDRIDKKLALCRIVFTGGGVFVAAKIPFNLEIFNAIPRRKALEKTRRVAEGRGYLDFSEGLEAADSHRVILLRPLLLRCYEWKVS